MSQESPPSREFDMEIDIRAPRDAVWKAISNDDELTRWFAPEATIDAQIGGQVVWRWKEHHTWIQRVEICEPGRRLRTRYDSAVEDDQGGKRPLFIDFVLEGKGGLTTLRLTQSGFGKDAAFDNEYDGISTGWPVELRSLRLYLEVHRGRSRKLAWATASRSESPEEVWRKLTGKEALACGPSIQDLREGQAFRFETAMGDLFEGKTLRCKPCGFAGIASSHGDAFFRISVDRWGGQSHAWLWLGCYDQPSTRVEILQGHFETILQQMFAGTAHSQGA